MPARRNTATQADLDAVEPAVIAAFEANRKAWVVGDDNDLDAVESFLIAARNILERRFRLPHTEFVDGLSKASSTERWYLLMGRIDSAEHVEELEQLWSEVKTHFVGTDVTHFALKLIKAADKFVDRSGPVSSRGTEFKRRVSADYFGVH